MVSETRRCDRLRRDLRDDIHRECSLDRQRNLRSVWILGTDHRKDDAPSQVFLLGLCGPGGHPAVGDPGNCDQSSRFLPEHGSSGDVGDTADDLGRDRDQDLPKILSGRVGYCSVWAAEGIHGDG